MCRTIIFLGNKLLLSFRYHGFSFKSTITCAKGEDGHPKLFMYFDVNSREIPAHEINNVIISLEKNYLFSAHYMIVDGLFH